MDHSLTRTLREKWCFATVEDAVKLFHKARTHPGNAHVPLETIAVRCANSAFEYVSATIVGNKNDTAKRYGELCYARFKREIERVVTEPAPEEEFVC